MKAKRTKELFEDFHRENPEVYREFCNIAAELIRRGIRRYSAYAVMHVVRWHRIQATKGAGGWKINDHFVPHYARLWLERHPQHAGFFELRRCGE